MLAISPCLKLCAWAATSRSYDGLPLFACSGCGSEWVRTEPWAPRQDDGSWPPGVREELLREEELTPADGEGPAGSAGSGRTTAP